MSPEARARQTIDALLTAAGWHVCDVASANIRAATGVAIREFPLNAGHGFADYLLYVNGKACGVISVIYRLIKFGEEFIVQRLRGNPLDKNARVVICNIQRMFTMLKGKDLPIDADEECADGAEALFKDSEPTGYSPAIPIESFDIVITEEAHRSIEYGHAQAVADGINVNYDVYRITTEVTEQGAKVDKG